MKPKSTLRSFLALAGSSLLAVFSASAGQIWDGGSSGPGDDNWNTAANWDGDALPTFTNAITFTGNTRNGAVNNLAANSIIGGINFTNDGSTGKTNAFTLSSAGITLGGNITTTASSSAITDIISLAMILNANRTITTNANHNLTISGIISQSDTRGLIKEGAGTLTLSGNNSYNGNITVSAGTVKIGHLNAFGSSGLVSRTYVTKVTVASGATVDFNGIVDAHYGYTISGTGVGGLGALVNTGAAITAAYRQATNILLADHATIGGTFDWGLIAAFYSPTSLDLNGKTLTKAGANTITLVNTTTTAGNIQVDAGTLAFGYAVETGAVGVNGGASAITLANSSGVNLNVVRNSSIGSLAGGGATGGNVTISNGITLTVGALNTNTSFAGAIGGSGGVLTKTGSGTLTLTNTSAYSGATTVNGGKLVMGDAAADTFATSGVTVSSGATLGGSGKIAGNLVLNAESALNAKDGGKLAPGNSPGVLTASGTTTFNTGSIFAWTIDTDVGGGVRGTEYSGLNTTSVINSGSGAVFQIVTGDSEGFADNFWTTNHNWNDIFKNATGSASLGNNWSTVFSSFAYSDGTNPITNVGTYGSFSWTSSGSTLTWTAIPEPTSALAGLLLTAGLLRRRRK